MKLRMLALLVLCACLAVVRAEDAGREGSVFDLPSTWTNQHDQAVRLGDLKGQPQVLVLFFSHCTFACPRITGDLKTIEKALPEDQRGRVSFVMVSFDVARDVPARLREFAEQMDINRPGWTLLHGTEDDTQDLAAALGVRYRKEGEDFAHANLITLLDADGRIVYQREGLDSDLGEFIAKLGALL